VSKLARLAPSLAASMQRAPRASSLIALA
jgi:hypothetical protein